MLSFAIPSGWRRFVLPRRADAPPMPPVQRARVQHAAELITAFHGDVLSSFGHRKTSGEIAEAGRACLSEDPAASPLGAAAVACVIAGLLGGNRLEEADAFGDYWRDRHGLPFAAAATAELANLWSSGPGVTAAAPDREATGYPAILAGRIADRLRRAVTAAAPEDYQQVVAALAGVRGPSLPQRAVISVMAPDEIAWAHEIIGQVLGRSDRWMIKMLLLSVVTDGSLGLRLAEETSTWQVTHDSRLLYTFVAGVGDASVPALTHWLDEDGTADGQKKLLGALAAVGTDEAFAALVDRLDRPHVPGAVAEVAARHPDRALRVLAASDRPAATRLLRTQVVSRMDLAAEIRPQLAGPAAERLDAVVGALTAAAADSADPADLPGVLADPPWITPVTRKPLVVPGLTAGDPARVAWQPGEREAWGQSDWARRHGGSLDFARVARLVGTPEASPWDEIAFFLAAPDELTRPLIERWRPADVWDVAEWGRALLARYDEAAVPVLTDCARRAPVTVAPVLAPIASPEVALLTAGWHGRLRSVRGIAATWLSRHAAAAARALVPVATGPVTGKAAAARADAEDGLRALAGAGHAGEVRAAAEAFGPEAVAAVEEILAVDPLTILPKVIPDVPEWANPALLPPIRLTGGRGTLPASAVGHLLTMLAMSRLGEAYPGLDPVRAACEPADLAAFAWALFTEWREAGHPAKQNWALDATGLLGDDDTVRRLAPVIRAWPGEGGHARAVTGLDVLAEIGTDVALMYLHGIAQKVKFRGLRERAQEKIAELAAALGLSADELADRLVPDLGLDAGGSMVLDYGRRQFTVGFDEQLKPFVADASGRRLKALPKPGAQDDPVLAPEAYQRFSALKKDVRAIAADQVRRLERAMVDQRRWSGADFQRYFAGHPLLRHLVRRLVWLRIGESTGVRLAEDGTFADVTDETVALHDDEEIAVAHPLRLGDALPAWAEVFADYEILQPFPQLGREVEALAPEQIEERLGRAFLGVRVPTTTLLGLERRGWHRGAPQDAGVQDWFERDVPGDLTLVAGIDPGIAVGALDVLPEQQITEVYLDDRHGYRGYRRRESSRLAELDPIVAAEALRDLTEVLR
ncbi:hypothetical protein AMIS_61730 [Actinoplanes missouriensis 431]|uniref:DUF4132 domain-containing protein n=1 Tax=Actinoplanes missouriensis (strain ATCC 14538 / DSM 43046 / CBS 188.64 / JCM 3121 / NBRC 102363 / NCIMB 12654 / NRRL B-3342 / UNCC 431) TaxID=512565 RepID=I0HEF6_ACTM4|nr:DUF4132 domain-containing protein [Actinoplanes missouriensis]BAL91393.1 hypothetical protein AMIS_61730 [Actinoplanes missouriensis 431]